MSANEGKIKQVLGAVVDVSFTDQLPQILDALVVVWEVVAAWRDMTGVILPAHTANQLLAGSTPTESQGSSKQFIQER